MWIFLCVLIVYGTLSVNSEDNKTDVLKNSQRQFVQSFPSNFNPFLPNGGFVFPGQINNFPAPYNPTIQQTTSAYQTNRPINNNPPLFNAYGPSNPFLPQTTSAYQTNRPVIQSSFLASDRISDRKCKEYADIGKKVFFAGSLTPLSNVQGIKTEQCENSQGLISGGENAKAGEFPHMAAIGYEDFNNEVHFSCGGSLISERFVLTAAHCKKAKGSKPTVVRIGESVLKEKYYLPDKDVRVDQFIIHENYSSRTKKNDIALIRLKRDVKLSKYLKPACLMTSNTIHKQKAIATGFGILKALAEETSNILQKVVLDIKDNNNCKGLFGDYTLDNTQICAGGSSDGKDTCEGDSGGPLQVTDDQQKCVYIILGITSYGNKYCGKSAGVYTKVSAYLDWIERHVWLSKATG